MRYRIVDKDGFRVVGCKARVPIVHLGENTAISEFVRGIDAGTLQRLAQLSDQEPRGIVAAVDNADGREEGSELDYYHGVVTGADAGLTPDYAVLGKVTKGMDVVQAIGELGDPASGGAGTPLQSVVIEGTKVRER